MWTNPPHLNSDRSHTAAGAFAPSTVMSRTPPRGQATQSSVRLNPSHDVVAPDHESDTDTVEDRARRRHSILATDNRRMSNVAEAARFNAGFAAGQVTDSSSRPNLHRTPGPSTRVPVATRPRMNPAGAAARRPPSHPAANATVQRLVTTSGGLAQGAHPSTGRLTSASTSAPSLFPEGATPRRSGSLEPRSESQASTPTFSIGGGERMTLTPPGHPLSGTDLEDSNWTPARRRGRPPTSPILPPPNRPRRSQGNRYRVLDDTDSDSPPSDLVRRALPMNAAEAVPDPPPVPVPDDAPREAPVQNNQPYPKGNIPCPFDCPEYHCRGVYKDPAALRVHLNEKHSDAAPSRAVLGRASRGKTTWCGICGSWQTLNNNGRPRKHVCAPRLLAANVDDVVNRVQPEVPAQAQPPVARSRVHDLIRAERGPLPPNIAELTPFLGRGAWVGEVAKALEGVAAALWSENADLASRWYARFVELSFYEKVKAGRSIPRSPPKIIRFPCSNPNPVIPPPEAYMDVVPAPPPEDDGGVSDAVRAAQFASVNKVKQAVASLEGVVPASLAPAASVRELLGKFSTQPYGPLPQTPPDLIPIEARPVIQQLDVLVPTISSFVVGYISSRNPRSARATSPWTYAMWKDAVHGGADPGAASVAAALARVIIALMAGKANGTPLHYALLDARGVALTKGAGQGTGVRPICVIDPLVRMTSAALLHLTKDAFATSISDYEFGLGTKGGLEALSKGIQAILDLSPEFAVLELDIRNAFNTLSRAHLLTSLHHLVRGKGAALRPQLLLPWTDFLLRTPATVTFRDPSCNRVVSTRMSEGVPQGEVLSPWLYDVWMSAVLAPIRTQFFGQAIIAGCHDGLFIVGLPAVLPQVYTAVKEALLTAHQEMNPSKFNILHLNPPAVLAQVATQIGVPVDKIHADGIVVAGVPVGTAAYVHAYTSQVAESVRILSSKLGKAARQASPNHLSLEFNGSLQGLVTAARLCLASKVIHLLRALPTERALPHLGENLDRAILSEVVRMAHLSLPEGPMGHMALECMSLPPRLGGLGFTNAFQTAPAAAIASWALVGPLVLKQFIEPLAKPPVREVIASTMAHLDACRAGEDGGHPLERGAVQAFTRLCDTISPGLGDTLRLLNRGAEEVTFRLGDDRGGTVVSTLSLPASLLADFSLEGFLLGWQRTLDPNIAGVGWVPHTKYAHHLQRKLSWEVNRRRDAKVNEGVGRFCGNSAAIKVASRLSGREATAAAAVTASAADPHSRLSDFHVASLISRRLLLDAPVNTNLASGSIFSCAAPLKTRSCGKVCRLDGAHGFRCTSAMVHGGRTSGHRLLADAFTHCVSLPVFRNIVAPRLAHGVRVEPAMSQFFEIKGARGQNREAAGVGELGERVTTTRADILLVRTGRAGVLDDERYDVIDFKITDVQPENPANSIEADLVANASGTAAASRAEADKVKFYSDRFILPGTSRATFRPFGADTHGSIGPEATRLLNELASTAYPPTAVERNGQIELVPNPLRSQLLRQMRTYISVALVRGSADVTRRWALHCVPPDKLPPASKRALQTRGDQVRAMQGVPRWGAPNP